MAKQFKNAKQFFTVFVTVAIFLIASTAKAADDPIPLYQSSHNIKTLIASEKAENANDWKDFTNKHCGWNATIDKASGTPTIAFGKPIKIIDASNLNEKSIIAATKIFLNENKNIFKVNTEQLKLKRIEQVQNRWLVTFGQVFDDFDVMFTEVQFTINLRGEVFAFKITFFDNIELPKTKQVPMPEILETVRNSFNDNPIFDKIFDKKETNSFQSDLEEKQFIIPIYKGNSVDYHLVHQVNTSNSAGMRLYESFVDAHSGKILWQKSCIKNFEAKIKMNVETFDKYNFEPTKIFPMSRGKIIVNGKEKILDKNGEITLTEPATKIRFDFESELTKVFIASDENSTPYDEYDVFNIVEGENEILLKDEWYRHFNFALHHINVAYDKILGIDPSLTCMNVNMPVIFYEKHSLGINAFYSPGMNAIGFTTAFQDTVLFSTCPAIMYHEYGHAINRLFYRERGVEFMSGVCNEALADVNKNMILDDPIGTQKLWVNQPDRYIRNSDNDNTYPDSLIGQNHHDGKILAGAFWDLRKLTDVETAYKLSHFARYELPDDADVGIAFFEWFMAVLIADDDDGDLTNGTPNYDAIITAFNKHQIGTNLFIRHQFEHTPLKDLPLSKTSQEVFLSLSPDNFALPVSVPDSIWVVYSTNYFVTSEKSLLKKTGNNYTGKIPGFDTAVRVQYYFEYLDKTSNVKTKYEKSRVEISDFNYYAGFKQLWKEDFENNPNYDIQSEIIYGLNDGFEIALPENVYYIGIIQYDGNTTGFGKSLVTGSKTDYSPNDNRWGFIYDGFSTATSKRYNIPKVDGNLYLSLWSFEWYYPIGQNYLKAFSIMYRTNNMNSWDTIYTSHNRNQNETQTANYAKPRLVWKRNLFKLPSTVKNANDITLRFHIDTKINGVSWTLPSNIMIDDIQLLTDEDNTYTPSEFNVEIGAINPAGAGTVTGAGKYEENTAVILEAIPNSGYEFGNWTDENDNEISTENPFTFILTQDTVIIANFEDVDGISETSDNSFRISSNPNPITNETNIIIYSEFPQIVSGSLADISGKILATLENLFVSEGETIIPLKEIFNEPLTVGAYIFTITANEKNYSVKLIKGE